MAKRRIIKKGKDNVLANRSAIGAGGKRIVDKGKGFANEAIKQDKGPKVKLAATKQQATKTALKATTSKTAPNSPTMKSTVKTTTAKAPGLAKLKAKAKAQPKPPKNVQRTIKKGKGR